MWHRSPTFSLNTFLTLVGLFSPPRERGLAAHIAGGLATSATSFEAAAGAGLLLRYNSAQVRGVDLLGYAHPHTYFPHTSLR